jgi:uncharacterized GH25 family protein
MVMLAQEPKESAEKRLVAQGVGGTVLKESGEPIAGVQVFLEPANRATSAGSHFEKTGVDGRWWCSHVASILPELRLRMAHPDYATRRFMVGVTRQQEAGAELISLPELLAGAAVVLMPEGFAVSGRVLDTAGKPVEGAKISGGDYPVWTPFDGRFTLKHCGAGGLALLVQARGHAPVRQTVRVGPDLGALQIQLEKGNVLRGRVIDPRGQPIGGAVIAVRQWQGMETPEWKWTTDAAGRFAWDSAPAGELLGSITREGYEPVSGRVLRAVEEEQVIRLQRPWQLVGQVEDAESHKPVIHCSITPGRVVGESVQWDRSRSTNLHQPRFTLALPGSRFAQVLWVEAEGYYGERSRVIQPEEDEPEVRIALTKGQVITGWVALPNGTPAAGARVALGVEEKPVALGDGRFFAADSGCLTTADATGRFQFSPHRQVSWLAAVHDQGYAETFFDGAIPTAKLVLAPWGRMAGWLRAGGQPLTNQLVGLGRLDERGPRLRQQEYTALTDARGRFVFEKAPAGRQLAGRVVNGMLSHWMPVEIKPGETARINLDHPGRRVSGRLRMAGLDPEADWGQSPIWLRVKLPPLVVPSRDSPEAQRSWRKQFWDSEAGWSRRAAEVRYVLVIEENGRFRGDEIPAGRYELEAHYHETSGDASGNTMCRGVLKQDLAIPALEPADGSAFELGVLEVPRKRD